LRKLFDKFDTDHSGSLSRSEVKAVVKKLPEHKGKKDCNELSYLIDKSFRIADLDRNGVITYDEFYLLYYTFKSEKVRQSFNFQGRNHLDHGEMQGT
jgi:Ca2+-binding EF-hand superfamily protein